MKYGFDNDKYVKIQSQHIKERIAQFGNKLYLELGGKLFDDYHASRVLPGFKPDTKLAMLQQLSDSAEIVIVISAIDIEKNKVRQDLGITYDVDVLRLREEFMKRGFLVSGVVITHYNGQSSADAYRQKLERLGIRAYYHYTIEGYPNNVELIDSDEGFGKNDYVPTTRPLVIVTAPGPGSGKMAVFLSQLYQEHRRGITAGYAKFETFPVWSLSLKHPVNIAYEAATADLNDVNMIDPFHYEAYNKIAINYNRDVEIFPVMNALFEGIYGENPYKSPTDMGVNMIDPFHYEAYNKIAINYNRDVEIFPVLNALFEGIYGENPYKSPTDMGVNMIGFCISDDEVCCDAAKHEIIRRYFTALNELAEGEANDSEVKKIALLFKQAGINTAYRKTTVAARERREQSLGMPTAAIELADGTIITSEQSDLLGPSAALILNATKHLAGIDHGKKLIPQSLIEPIQHTKIEYLRGRNPRLHTDEVLVALSVLSTQDDDCRRALEVLPMLDGCQMHSTVMLNEVDRKIFRKLGVGLTCDPNRKK